MDNITVIKRDGTSQLLEIQKIRVVVEWACNDLSVNPIALESALTERFRNGITTREIQNNLINCALEMCSPSEPDWRYVAGRLHIWSLWKETIVSRGYLYNADKWLESMKDLYGTENKYDHRIWDYTLEELREAYSWINPDLDLDYDYAGASLLTSRYLLKDELPQEAFLLCSLLLALPNTKTKLATAREFYHAIASRQISLATPILANLRIPNGSLSSCFILSMEDNLESIFKGITDTAKISKNGGGVGVNLSRIRATGSTVMGKVNSSGGVIPWIKLLNDTAIAVNQGGRRAGAVTVGLDIWHLDIPEFLEMQTENGDQRRKAYDVFPQLVICDEFMRRVQTNTLWTLVDPQEVRTKLNIELAELWGTDFEQAYEVIESKLGDEIILYKQVSAKDLFKEIMRCQIETGLPYLAFKDTINRANPNSHKGYIPGVNLCVESYSNVTPGQTIHCCNLVSLNLAQLTDNSHLEHLCRLAVRILDNTIDLTNPPIGEAQQHNDMYRTIGVGVMGLADWLAIHESGYHNLGVIKRLFSRFAYHCTKTSADLAIERGAYPTFDGSGWSKGLMVGNKDLDWFSNHDPEYSQDWKALALQIKRTGIRNSHITAIAPNTSSSLIQGCTASILPTHKRFYVNKAGKGSVPIAPPFIKEKFWYYQENVNLCPQIVVSATAEIQKWIDTGISMELLFNLNEGIYFEDPSQKLTAKNVFDILLSAWQQGCKAVYYVRTVQPDTFKEDACSSCAN